MMSVKRSRSSPSEQVESAVARYRQKRRLPRPDAVSVTQTVQQMALSETLASETSDNDAVSQLLPTLTDPSQAETQYARFKSWIAESPDVYKPELAQLLYPMFTHLYLDLISGRNMAGKFLRRHQSTFMGNAEFNSFIRILGTVSSPEEMAGNEGVSSFYASKYTVTLTPKTFHYLMKFVHLGETPLLLHLLRAKIDLKLSDPLAACSKPESVRRLRSELSLKKPSSPCSSKSTDFQRLKDIIQSVRSGPTPLPSAILYRISNVPSPVSCADISEDSSLMCLGAENSSVYLYNLLPPTSKVRRRDDHARIRLSCDFLPEDEEEDGEEREKSGSVSSDAPDVLLAHSGPVYDLHFIKNKNYLLSVSEDTTMRLWDTSTASNKVIYSGHSYPVWCMDVDRLGYNVITGSMDRTAKLWNLEYTFPIRIYAGHEKDVDCISFHPNCNYFATGSVDKSVRLWSHADGKMVRVLTGHKSGVYALAFSPDGKYLATGGEDRRIRIWDLASSRQLKELKGHSETIYTLVWSLDSSLLSSGGLDGIVRIWDVNGSNSSSQYYSPSSSSSEDSGPPSGNSSMSKNGSAAELVAAYKTNCYNILDLRYSHHNTLLATALVEEPKS